MVYELRERREGFIIPPIYLFCHSRPPRFGRLEITTGVRPSSVDHRTLRPAGWRGVNRSTRSSTAMCHRYSIFTTRNRNPGVDVTPGTKDRTHQPQSCRRRTTVHDAAFSRGRRHEASQPASYTPILRERETAYPKGVGRFQRHRSSTYTEAIHVAELGALLASGSLVLLSSRRPNCQTDSPGVHASARVRTTSSGSPRQSRQTPPYTWSAVEGAGSEETRSPGERPLRVNELFLTATVSRAAGGVSRRRHVEAGVDSTVQSTLRTGPNSD